MNYRVFLYYVLVTTSTVSAQSMVDSGVPDPNTNAASTADPAATNVGSPSTAPSGAIPSTEDAILEELVQVEQQAITDQQLVTSLDAKVAADDSQNAALKAKLQEAEQAANNEKVALAESKALAAKLAAQAKQEAEAAKTAEAKLKAETTAQWCSKLASGINLLNGISSATLLQSSKGSMTVINLRKAKLRDIDAINNDLQMIKAGLKCDGGSNAAGCAQVTAAITQLVVDSGFKSDQYSLRSQVRSGYHSIPAKANMVIAAISQLQQVLAC